MEPWLRTRAAGSARWVMGRQDGGGDPAGRAGAPGRPARAPPPPNGSGARRLLLWNSSGRIQKCSRLVGSEGLSESKFFVIDT